MDKKYPVITLCGSCIFKEEFVKVAEELTLQHYIVLSPSFVLAKSLDLIISSTLKEALPLIQKQRIDMSDQILVVNKNGYIDDLTKAEIEYAKKNNKKVNYLYYKCKKLTCLYKKDCEEFEMPFCFRKPYALAVAEEKNAGMPICEWYKKE